MADNEVRSQLARAQETIASSTTPQGQALANRPKTVNELLMEPRIQESLRDSLPNLMTPERFARLVMSTIRSSTKLAQCDAITVVAAAVQAAQLGLELGPLGEAYLVPYWNNDRKIYEAQFQISYHGYVTLAHRSGVAVEGWPVHRNDDFEISRGTGQNKFLRHRPAIDNRGDVYCYYAIAEWNADGHHEVFQVLSIAEAVEIRDRYSKTPDKGPWATQFDEMAVKSAVRRLAKWIPKAVYVQKALTVDESVMHDVSPDMAEDAWVQRERQFEEERSQPAATLPSDGSADTAPPDEATTDASDASDRCPECNWTGGEHADGCSLEAK